MMFTAPKTSGAFHWVQLSSGPALVCDALAPFASHFFTTRAWTLGRPSNAAEGWIEVAAAAAVRPACLTHLRQVHGSAAVVRRKAATGTTSADSADSALQEADILLTDDPDQAIAVKAADCLPILFVDRKTRVVAAAHAGWRGLASRVPQVAVDRLETEFGSSRRDLLVAVGPAIGACCYEVGSDVRARFDTFPTSDVERWFAAQPAAWSMNPSLPTLVRSGRPDHWFFDGWQCARDQLASAGVPVEQIFVVELCTASHPDAFCSYRREGAAAGRMVGVIKPKT
jgi:YfiH family protein